jgi:hypothetical protein
MREGRDFAGLIPARSILLALALAAAGAAGARAQTATPSPARTTVDGEEMLYGNYEVVSSVELGARGLSIDGSREKYYSDLNYRQGFRVFDSSVLMRARQGYDNGLFDTLLVTSSGFGADPHGAVRVNVEKARLYKFDANFRRNAYNNQLSCCNTAQIRTATYPNVGLSTHFARTKHNMSDFDLRLLPTNRRIRFNAGYSNDRYRGPAGSSLSFIRDDYLIDENPWRSRSDEVRGGFESKIGGLDLNFTQGYRWFHYDSVFTATNNAGQAPPPGNVVRLDTYRRENPTRGRAWYSRVSAHTQINNRFDITARYVYTNTRAEFGYVENSTGVGAGLENISPNAIIDRYLTTGAGENERPTHIFDVGFTATVTRKARVSNTFRYNRFTVDGDLDYNELRFLRRANGTLFLPYPVDIDVRVTRELELRRFENNLEFDYDFGPRLSVFVGHRYQDRRQQSRGRGRVYPLQGTVPSQGPAAANAFSFEDDVENDTNGFFGGLKARPVKSWRIYFDANRGTSDNAFTRVDYYDTVSFRLRNNWQIRRGLNASASFVTRDNNNPGVADEALLGVPEFDVDISSRIFTSSLDWSSHSRVWLSTGYTYQHVTSDIGILTNTSPVRFGRSQFYLRDHFFFFNASVRVLPRLTVYAAYRGHKDTGQGDRVNQDAAGLFIRSIPLSFQSPEARAVLRVNRSLDLTAGYQFYNYNEKNQREIAADQYRNQDYRAHLPFVSLRFYFGRRE